MRSLHRFGLLINQVNFNQINYTPTLRYSCHERLSELLNILRNMLEKYPALQSPAVVNSASYVVVQLKDFAEQVCVTQGDTLGCSQGSVDIKTKVLSILKHRFDFDVNNT